MLRKFHFANPGRECSLCRRYIATLLIASNCLSEYSSQKLVSSVVWKTIHFLTFSINIASIASKFPWLNSLSGQWIKMPTVWRDSPFSSYHPLHNEVEIMAAVLAMSADITRLFVCISAYPNCTPQNHTSLLTVCTKFYDGKPGGRYMFILATTFTSTVDKTFVI